MRQGGPELENLRGAKGSRSLGAKGLRPDEESLAAYSLGDLASYH